MELIKKARELGFAVQQDEAYLAMVAANEACDKAEGLQGRIDSFNVLREELSAEVMKEDKDTEKLAAMDVKLRAEYELVMQVPEMIAFNDAKTVFSEKMAFVNQIINESANGANPDEIQLEEAGCGGSCSSCSGCN